MTEPTDVELAGLLGSREPAEREAAFAALFGRHRQKAFELAWRVLGDASLAADAVQEAFLTVYKKGPRFEARAQFSSWLYRVVLNQSIDLRRRERRHRAASLGEPSIREGGSGRAGASDSDAHSDPASPRPSPDDEALTTERAEAVRVAIERLSPKLAAVVILRYPEGLSYEEIGEILALPPGTVRSRLNRAHAALKDILADRLEE